MLLRFSNMAGTLKTGMTGLLQKITEKTFLQIKEIDADGKESYVIKEYSPELLKELEKTLLLRFSLL
jgi:hypothetical protein